MKNVSIKIKKNSLFLLYLFFFSLLIGSQQSCIESETRFLAKVDIIGTVDQVGLPVYAHLQGTDGQDYALVIVSENQLVNSGMVYEILDVNDNAASDTSYLIALERIPGARAVAEQELNVLYDDGRNIVLRISESEVSSVSKMGFEVEWLSETPIVFQEKQNLFYLEEVYRAVDYNEDVDKMMSSVYQETLYDYASKITGEKAVIVGGNSYTIKTRHTNSGIPIQKATQYVYEFMDNLGLSVSYHEWSSFSSSNRNVIGEKIGSTSPDEIILIIAHLDCMPSGSIAPGADDNGTGTVGVMIAAEILSQYNFEKTIRFVFFTGEEQGILGSKKYASKIQSDGDNVVAVLNLEMLGWDKVGGPVFRIHTRRRNNSGYSSDMALASIVQDVVSIYGMTSLVTPVIDSDGLTQSDHSSFWNKGIPAIIVNEDDENDMGKNFHTTRDRVSTLNLSYFTNMVKVAVGTSAHMAVPVGGEFINAAFDFTTNKLTVNFTDTTKVPYGSKIIAWYWDFGDGETSTERNPVYTYAEPGTYTVKLTVRDQEGITDTYSKEITVTSQDDPDDPECWEECEEVGTGCDKETVCETVCEE